MSDCCMNPHAVHWTAEQQAELVHGAVVVFSWAGKQYTAEVIATHELLERHVLFRAKSLKGHLVLRFEPCGAVLVLFNGTGAWGFGGALTELGIQGAAPRQGVLL